MKNISRIITLALALLSTQPFSAAQGIVPALQALGYFGGGHLANVAARGIGRTGDEWLGKYISAFNAQPAKAIAVIDGKHAGNEGIRLLLSKYIEALTDMKNPAFKPYEAGMSYLSAQELFYFIHDAIRQAPEAFDAVNEKNKTEGVFSSASASLALDVAINFIVGWAISFYCKKMGDRIAGDVVGAHYNPASKFPLKNIISTSIGAPLAFLIKKFIWDPHLAPLLKLRPGEDPNAAPSTLVTTGFKAGDKMTFAVPALQKLLPIMMKHPLFAAFMTVAVPASVVYYNQPEEKPAQN